MKALSFIAFSLFFMLIRLSYSFNTTFCSNPCLTLLLAEFQESQVLCNTTMSDVAVDSRFACNCIFRLLDLTSCVTSNVSKIGFDLSVRVAQNALTSKYTAACRKDLDHTLGRYCDLEGITDRGLQITFAEGTLAAMGVGFEILTGYQVVRPNLISPIIESLYQDNIEVS